MYIAIVILLLGVAPAASILYEITYLHSAATLLLLVGKWFTFWAAGVRLFIAGLRQTVQPRFTAQEIFKISGDAAFPIVREVGFGNLSMGTLGLATLVRPAWLLPAALVGGLYYGFAGLGHVFVKVRDLNETVAMISDIAIGVLLLGFFALALTR